MLIVRDMIVNSLIKALPFIRKTREGIDENFNSIHQDSRKICQGDFYLAIVGATLDGHDFIRAAISLGANGILLSDLSLFETLSSEFSHIHFVLYEEGKGHLLLATAAEFIYDFPAEKLRLIGVTGTNGKTTTATIINYLLRSQNEKTALIGTIAYDLDGEVTPASHTTPDPLQLQKIFKRCLALGITTVVMEVSSHSADQRRFGSAKFESLVFTNLTGEHLDYHLNMENYFLAKRSLFVNSLASGGLSIINSDDEWGQRLLKEFPLQQAYGFGENISHFRTTPTGSSFYLGKELVKTTLFGEFNAANITAALMVCKGHGLSLSKCIAEVANFDGVSGRMQSVKLNSGATAFVDYAHTDDALYNVGRTLKKLPHSKIITVFGCGGDRDRKKRPRMAEAVEHFSDLIIVTADNTRNESLEQIFNDISEGFQASEKPLFIACRGEAIERAIGLSCSGDLILVAGKGHEDYQRIANETTHFSDFETLKRYSGLNQK